MIDHKETIIEYVEEIDIETWLCDQPDDQFPTYDASQGEKSYPEKYISLKKALIPLHNIVEKGAMVDSFFKWKNNLKEKMKTLKDINPIPAEEVQKISQLLDDDQMIYLNQHGTGHVNKVAEKAFELLRCFTVDPLTPTEVFLLLCAIQIHDIGNVYGRDGHEISMQQATIDIMKPIIPDGPTRNMIYRIAQVHSGSINGNKDTIGTSNLHFERALFKKTVREPILAAILRFADELADDSTRADKEALRLGTLPPKSVIYHQYSNALHAVNIRKNEINKTLYLSLDYYIDSQLIVQSFYKDRKKQLLIDEIFYRTIKMEQERRYCMRYLSQYLPLVEIRVQIQIDSEYDLLEPEVIKYTLRENGYPSQKITIECQENTGKKVIASLKGKGWRL